jgi:hypothetical protein
MKEIRLKIGESAILRNKFLGSKFSVAFCGMPSESVFSLVLCHTCCHNSLAFNLYFPTNQRDIALGNARLSIRHVTPEELIFDVQAETGDVKPKPVSKFP